MNNHRPARVLLADGDTDVRRALALLLHTALGLAIIGEAADLSDLTAPGLRQADLLLIDWLSLVPDARQAIATLRALNTRLRVIVLSARPEDGPTALSAGADAFISKVDSPEQVLATLRAALEDRLA